MMEMMVQRVKQGMRSLLVSIFDSERLRVQPLGRHQALDCTSAWLLTFGGDGVNNLAT